MIGIIQLLDFGLDHIDLAPTIGLLAFIITGSIYLASTYRAVALIGSLMLLVVFVEYRLYMMRVDEMFPPGEEPSCGTPMFGAMMLTFASGALVVGNIMGRCALLFLSRRSLAPKARYLAIPGGLLAAAGIVSIFFY